MSTQRAATTVPGSKLRTALWIAQWPAVVLVPYWLLVGTELTSGYSWSAVIVSFIAPALMVLLLIAAVLSVGIRSARRGRGGPWYVWLLVGVWISVVVQPFLIERQGDDGTGPSALERLGLSPQLDIVLVDFFFWAGAVLLALAWISTGAAGYAPPFGDGSDRKVQQRLQRERDRLDDLNRWRPSDEPAPDPPTRAAPGADSRN